MSVRGTINKQLIKLGQQLNKYPPKDLRRRSMLFEHFGINKLFDVGAYNGKYGNEIRSLGFTGRIISFEPMKKSFDELKVFAGRDGKWEVRNIALGNNDGSAQLNVSKNSYSSSLLDILSSHVQSAPDSAYTHHEKIEVYKLDSIFDDHYVENDSIFLKIDTQGFEKQVLDGAANSLNRILGVQVEMSIIPLYSDGMNYLEMIDYLNFRGFELFSLENGFSDPNSGRLLQVDGIFFREDQDLI